MRFFLRTYGCTLNQSDGDSMRALLLDSGASEAPSERDADVVILNTCAVKRATEQRIVEAMKRLSSKPLVVCGCLASSNRKLVEKAAPRASIVGTGAVAKVVDAASAAIGGKRAIFMEWDGKEGIPFLQRSPIARVPIGEGCLSSCSFCATKLARPLLRTYSIPRVLACMRASAEAGALEIQLTAQDAGAYGMDRGSTLEELMEKISAAFAASPFRVRLGMINPEHAIRLRRLPSLLAAEPFYHFLHLPIQSGSDRVLRLMGRRYTVEEFEEAVGRFRREVPGLTLATDIICGHPGESEEDFQRTLELLERIRFDVVNISRFSIRPGTRAAGMEQLPSSIINERTRKASEVARRISLERNMEWIGRSVACTILERVRTPVARTREYKHVALEGGRIGERVVADITGASPSCLKGRVKEAL